MSNINFSFNGTNYSVEESALSAASAKLKSHLSTTMNGSGATINFGGTSYNIDSAKLSAATNDFISYLATIAGSGSKVVVNGVEYSVDSAKLQNAISELHTAFGNLGTSTPVNPSPEGRLEGDGVEYYTLAPTALTFRSTEPLNEFQSVKVNGQVVDPSNYTLEEGSTIVTLSIDYLKTLPVGGYNIEVVSANNAPSGGFSVVAPDLNTHGFYYNQPYTAYVDYFGATTAFFIRDDGTLDAIVLSGGTETCTYTVSGNIMTVTSVSMGELHLTFSEDGTEAYNTELATYFVLGNESIMADEDYIYVYDGSLGGYVVNAIDKTKASYGAIKTGINGKSTVKLANLAFGLSYNLVTAPQFPDSVNIIGEGAFEHCRDLTKVTIPGNVTIIEDFAFNGCTSLNNITFEGTIEQWNTIVKGESWKGNTDFGYVPATEVVCSDGTVPLN